jgi:hypothetical protein
MNLYIATNLKKSWKLLFKNYFGKKIIQLLQEDVNANNDIGAESTRETNLIHYLNFERVNTKLGWKKLLPKKWENDTKIKLRQ